MLRSYLNNVLLYDLPQDLSDFTPLKGKAPPQVFFLPEAVNLKVNLQQFLYNL